MTSEEAFLGAFDRIVRAQRTELSGVARREGLSAEDALDSVHDAFCTFLEIGLRGKLPLDEDAHGPFLSGIVRNTARNSHRRHLRSRPHDAIEDIQPSTNEPSAETLVVLTEECLRLRGCVARLCENQRTVVMMRLLEERDGEDVAAALGLRRGHVDVLLHRARASLLTCMTTGEDDTSSR